MGRRLPPFAAVRAFEAAARHLSFRKAADELCLTPSAISHQVRALEDYLDTRLFERSGNGIALTLTGRGYAGKLTGLLDAFDLSTRDVTAQPDRAMRILCTPGFAARWLVPRMARSPFPEALRLQVSVGAPSTEFQSNGADLVIQWSTVPTPGVRVEPPMQSARYPVASPRYHAAEGLKRPADLRRAVLMHDETQDMWAEWFDLAGVAAPPLPRGPAFPNCELATSAAELGEGVALAYDMMVRDTLKSGRLVRLFETDTLPFVIYSVAYPEARAGDALIRSFRDWLFDEVGMTDGGALSAAE